MIIGKNEEVIIKGGDGLQGFCINCSKTRRKDAIRDVT